MAEISNEMYERLQQILEKQNGRSYTSEETKEIGDGLIDFYELLIKLGESLLLDKEEQIIELGNSGPRSVNNLTRKR